MRRIQIHLDEDMDDALAGQALARRIPKAALIREYLAAHVGAIPPGTTTTSAALIGAYDGDGHDSAHVDDVVYGR